MARESSNGNGSRSANATQSKRKNFRGCARISAQYDMKNSINIPNTRKSLQQLEKHSKTIDMCIKTESGMQLFFTTKPNETKRMCGKRTFARRRYKTVHTQCYYVCTCISIGEWMYPSSVWRPTLATITTHTNAHHRRRNSAYQITWWQRMNELIRYDDWILLKRIMRALDCVVYEFGKFGCWWWWCVFCAVATHSQKMGGVRWEEGAEAKGCKCGAHKRGIENKSKEHQILFVDFQELRTTRERKFCPHGKKVSGKKNERRGRCERSKAPSSI